MIEYDSSPAERRELLAEPRALGAVLSLVVGEAGSARPPEEQAGERVRGRERQRREGVDGRDGLRAAPGRDVPLERLAQVHAQELGQRLVPQADELEQAMRMPCCAATKSCLDAPVSGGRVHQERESK